MAFNLFKRKKKKDEPEKAFRAEVPAAAKQQGVSEADAQAPSVPAPVGTGSVIRHMHVSEKSSMGQAVGHYTFVVDPGATKPQVAKEVEKRYKVSVRSVKMVVLPGKSRRIGRYTGSTTGVKKAVVVLKEGQSIATA